jgi:hypothetical protein
MAGTALEFLNLVGSCFNACGCNGFYRTYTFYEMQFTALSESMYAELAYFQISQK